MPDVTKTIEWCVRWKSRLNRRNETSISNRIGFMAQSRHKKDIIFFLYGYKKCSMLENEYKIAEKMLIDTINDSSHSEFFPSCFTKSFRTPTTYKIKKNLHKQVCPIFSIIKKPHKITARKILLHCTGDSFCDWILSVIWFISTTFNGFEPGLLTLFIVFSLGKVSVYSSSVLISFFLPELFGMV